MCQRVEFHWKTKQRQLNTGTGWSFIQREIYARSQLSGFRKSIEVRSPPSKPPDFLKANNLSNKVRKGMAPKAVVHMRIK